MQVHFGIDSLRAEWPGAVACIGTFDGVHRGHREVIGTAVARAQAAETPCALVTFDRHPANLLAPNRAPRAIADLQSNLTQFRRLGVAVAVVLAFDRALSQTSAQDFFDRILVERLRANAIVVGYDFAFGHDRQGTPDWLAERIATEVIPPFEIDGRRVSSSAIRQAVTEGQMERAAEWLGRPFEIPGVVVPGRRLGRTLGFPTANLARSFDQVDPADGVYSGFLATSHGEFRAAISIGSRPAIEGATRSIEAHLLDYPGDSLYGQAVALHVETRLRDQLDFPSLDALRAQIAQDVEQVRGLWLPG